MTFVAQFSEGKEANDGVVFTPDNATTPTQYSVTKYNGFDNEVYIPSTYSGLNVTSIGNYAFWQTGITSIEIPDTVKTIGNSAFDGCTGLSKITFGDSSELASIGNSAFNGCVSLPYFNCPTGLTTIGRMAFAESGITTFSDGESLESLGEEAFKYSKLVHLYLYEGSTLTTIPNRCFYNCTSLNGISYDSYYEEVLPKFKTIGVSAFEGCTNLPARDFIDPTVIETIGDNAFKGCAGIPSGEGDVEFKKLTSVGNYGFEKCYFSGSITFSASSLSLGKMAFGSNEGITSLSFKTSGAVELGAGAFKQCHGIKTVVFGSGPTDVSVGGNCFQNCTRLNNVTFDPSLTKLIIGSYCFDGCSLAYGITLPNCGSIHSEAFYDAWDSSIDKNFFSETFVSTSTTSVSSEAFIFSPIKHFEFGTLKSVGTRAFYGSTIDAVPTLAEQVETYAVNETQFYTYTSIYEQAFASCKNLLNIDLTSASKMFRVSEKAFADIGAITSLKLPACAVFAGMNPFANDTFPNGVTIDGNATDYATILDEYNRADEADTANEWGPLFPTGTVINYI